MTNAILCFSYDCALNIKYLGHPKPCPPSGKELPFLSSDEALRNGTLESVSASYNQK